MFVTIFTPTYNRAYTLTRTFRSLCDQTRKNFEWLVVDDESTDGTEDLIKSFMESAPFEIRYFRKENGGKHTAYNIALREARGDLFFDIDSDDWMPQNGMSIINSFIPTLTRCRDIAGIIGLKNDINGNMLGRRFRDETKMLMLPDMQSKDYRGEYSIIFKTEIARKYEFPVITGEKYMPENVVYDKFEGYNFIATNNILTTCEYQPDGLSLMYGSLMVYNPRGFMFYHLERLKSNISFRDRLVHTLLYLTFYRLSVEKGNNETCEVPTWLKFFLSPKVAINVKRIKSHLNGGV